EPEPVAAEPEPVPEPVTPEPEPEPQLEPEPVAAAVALPTPEPMPTPVAAPRTGPSTASRRGPIAALAVTAIVIGAAIGFLVAPSSHKAAPKQPALSQVASAGAEATWLSAGCLG